MRYDWRIDCRPTTNIDRRDVVSQANEPADHTGELGLRRTIGFSNVTTSRTGTTGVSGINQDHRDTGAFGFVGHESTQLVESPAVQGCPLRATNRYPLPNALQIFQGNRSMGVFRFGNQLFADAVVGVFGKTAFFSREPLEFAFGRARPFGLQFGPQAALTVARVVDMAGRVDLPVAVHGDIGDTRVNPQCTFTRNRFWLVHFTGGGKEEHTRRQPQVAFPLPRLQQFQLPFPTYKRDAKPPINRPNRHGLVLQSPRQDAVIVGDTTRCFERAFRFAVMFVSVGNFGDNPHSHLRRQPKLIPHQPIAPVMEVVLPKGFGFPGRMTDPLTGSAGLFQRAPERACLFRGGEQFDLGNQFHAIHCSTNVLLFQDFKRLLLTFLDISVVGFRTDVSSRTNGISFCPQRRICAPIFAAKPFKLFLQPANYYAFEQTDNLGRSRYWRCADKQMHRVGHDLNCQNLKTVLHGDFCQKFFQPCLDRPNQTLFLIAQYPHQIGVFDICAVWAVVGFIRDRPILAKEVGFLHPLKRSGFRRQEL